MSNGDLALLFGGAWLLGASLTGWLRKRKAERDLRDAAAEYGDTVVTCDVELRPWWAWPFGGYVRVLALVEDADGELLTVCRTEER